MGLIRPAVVTCCSTRLDLLSACVTSMIGNESLQVGLDWNLVVVTWVPSPEVEEWVRVRSDTLTHVRYETNSSVGYVPNLRGMINLGFETCYALSDWAVLVNTDVVFGPDWLRELVQLSGDPDVIVNAQHVTRIAGTHTIMEDLGEPLPATFNQRAWDLLLRKYRRPGEYRTEEELGGWFAAATMPYVLHRKWWDRCGPWDLVIGGHSEAPDRRFFQQCHEAGAKFVLSLGSVVYHYEALERKGARPPGTAHLPEEGVVT